MAVIKYVGFAVVSLSICLIPAGGCGGEDNTEPVALAGSDQIGVVGLPVSLGGGGSYDDDDDPLTYEWTLASAPTGSQASLWAADTVSASFVPDLAGEYTVELVVDDGLAESAPDTMLVTVHDGGSAATWSATYGLSGDEEMEGLAPTPDGGFVICGLSDSFSANEDADALIVKIAADGGVTWAKTYGGAGDDMAIDIKPTPDGGFIVAGWTQSFGVNGTDSWILKLDEGGAVQWAKAYGGAGLEQAWSVDLTGGGYVFAGGTTSFGAGLTDYWVVNLTADGSVLWQRAYGGSGDDAPGDPYDEYVAKVVRDASGAFVVGSMSLSFGANGDFWALKLDPADGAVIWEFAYGEADEDANWSMSAIPTGGYLMSGSVTDPGTAETDAWALRLNDDGSIRWQKTYGIPGIFDEVLNQLPTSDGGALLSAYFENTADTDWRSSLLKVAPDGALQWSRVYVNGAISWTNTALELSDGYLAVGVSAADVVTWDEQLWVWRTDLNGLLGDACSLDTPLSLTVHDTQMTPLPTAATVTDTTATVTDTTVTAVDQALTPSYGCR